MKKYDKTDIEVGAIALTDKWKWESVLTIHKKIEALRAKEQKYNESAARMIKEIMAKPEYEENYKKVRKYYREL